MPLAGVKTRLHHQPGCPLPAQRQRSLFTPAPPQPKSPKTRKSSRCSQLTSRGLFIQTCECSPTCECVLSRLVANPIQTGRPSACVSATVADFPTGSAPSGRSVGADLIRPSRLRLVRAAAPPGAPSEAGGPSGVK